jgi:hypothetical protein
VVELLWTFLRKLMKQITKLKAFEISSVCHLNVSWSLECLKNTTTLCLNQTNFKLEEYYLHFVAQSVCIEATIVGLLGSGFDSRLKPCRCIKKRFYFRLFLIFLNDLFQFSMHRIN